MSGSKRRLYYWDTCIYLAWLKNEECYAQYMPGIHNLLLQCQENKALIITSTLTLVEVLNHSLGQNADREFTQLFNSEIHKAYDLDVMVALKARDYRAYYLEKGESYPALPDSIHLATAVINGVDEFHTFDDGKSGKGKERFSLLKNSGNIGGDFLTICRPPIYVAPPVQANLFDVFSPENTSAAEDEFDL